MATQHDLLMYACLLTWPLTGKIVLVDCLECPLAISYMLPGMQISGYYRAGPEGRQYC